MTQQETEYDYGTLRYLDAVNVTDVRYRYEDGLWIIVSINYPVHGADKDFDQAVTKLAETLEDYCELLIDFPSTELAENEVEALQGLANSYLKIWQQIQKTGQQSNNPVFKIVPLEVSVAEAEGRN